MWKSKFYGAALNRRVVLHAIDATPARWQPTRCRSFDRVRGRLSRAVGPSNHHFLHGKIASGAEVEGIAFSCRRHRATQRAAAVLAIRRETESLVGHYTHWLISTQARTTTANRISGRVVTSSGRSRGSSFISRFGG